MAGQVNNHNQALLNAYKMLGATPQNGLEEIKAKFKGLALKYHPDKGGDENVFNSITESFKLVFRHKKAAETDRQHQDLKTRSQDYIQSSSTASDSNGRGGESKGRSAPLFAKNDTHFNTKFNKFFDENRTVDDNAERGYEKFINAPDVKTSTNHYKIKKYEEPAPSVLCKSLGFQELGKKVNDFSGKNDSMHRLQYMDYMYAHTTDKIIDPNLVVERQEFKSLDDIRSNRESQNFALTDRDKMLYERQQNRDNRREHKRVTNLQKYDHYLSEHQKRMNQLTIH